MLSKLGIEENSLNLLELYKKVRANIRHGEPKEAFYLMSGIKRTSLLLFSVVLDDLVILVR